MQDELTLLAYDGLVARPRGDDPPPEFDDFRRAWRLVRLEEDGERQLAYWSGPDRDDMVVLTQGGAPETLLAAIDHGLDERRLKSEPEDGSFLHPGRPRWRGGRLDTFGMFAGWWPAEPDSRGLRLVRGETIELAPAPEGFVLVDWNSAAPVERFEAVEIKGAGWVPTVLPNLPYTAAQLWRSYKACQAAGAFTPESEPDLWAYEVFDDGGGRWFDAIVAILHEADPDQDFEVLCGFGAHIYANGHAYYDRMERELDRGGVKRENLGIVLSMEKPEFMDEALAARHRRLAARCG